MRKSDGGAVGVIAASEFSYSGCNDVLAMEMFQAIWPKSDILTDFPYYSSNGINHSKTPIYAIGNILRKGKGELSTKYTKWSGLVAYTKRIFHCFGDPSMKIYTEQPHDVITYMTQKSPKTMKVSEPVQMSLILHNGSVVIATGTEFDYSQYQFLMDGTAITGHNIIPIIGDFTKPQRASSEEGKIVNIQIENNTIDLEYKTNGEKNTTVRVRPINTYNSQSKEFPLNGDKISISTIGYEKGVYVVEIVEDGIIVDFRKVAI